MSSVTVHAVPTGMSGVVPVAPATTSNGYVAPLVHAATTRNVALAPMPWVSPVTALVMLT